MKQTSTSIPYAKSETVTDYSILKTYKLPTIEEQIAELHKQVEELRQEITVLKTLLPPVEYKYDFTGTTNTPDGEL